MLHDDTNSIKKYGWILFYKANQRREQNEIKHFRIAMNLTTGRTKSDRYGTMIKATPAAILHAPTPALRIAVGYSSAV